jgi:hypothetical protein
MTVAKLDRLLWQLMATRKRKAIRLWYAKLRAIKGPVTGWRGQK